MSKTTAAAGKAGKPNPGTISLKGMISYNRGGILSKSIHSGRLDVTLFCMAKGTSMSEHTSTREGFIYVIEGKGNFRLEGQDITMSPMTTIHMDRNAKHSLRAEQDTSFILVLSERQP
jgi:quercetin dioxygenase-like cupin family protein